LVNDKVVKASYNVKVDDIITINLGQKPLKVKVLSISEHTTKENAADNYIVVD
jgi:ribosomal 50S subunit-recycling heat shock protein